MKHLTRVLLIILLAVLIIMAACNDDYFKLKWYNHRYQKAIGGEKTEGLTLTIYYIPHYLLTRAPLTVEDLKGMEDTRKIVVSSDELAEHLIKFKQLDLSALRPTKEKYGMNACFYYVIESGEQKVLEVVMQQLVGEDDEAFGTFVNGIRVKSIPALYEIIYPFLSEEEHRELGLCN